jgi:hypothetical protein
MIHMFVRARSWAPFAVTMCLLASSGFAKPTVVVTGPAPVTKFLTNELSKKYVVKTSGPVSAMPTAKEVRDVTDHSKRENAYYS